MDKLSNTLVLSDDQMKVLGLLSTVILQTPEAFQVSTPPKNPTSISEISEPPEKRPRIHNDLLNDTVVEIDDSENNLLYSSGLEGL